MTNLTTAPPRIPAPPDIEDGDGGDDDVSGEARIWDFLAIGALNDLPPTADRTDAAVHVCAVLERWVKTYGVSDATLSALADELETIQGGNR